MPNLIFEVFNREGKLLKRGDVLGESLNINIDKDDYRYVVRDRDDETAVYKQGYLQEIYTKAESDPFPIMIADMRNGEVEIHSNTFKEGHTKLFIQRDGEAEKQEIELTSERIRLKLDPGPYLFYTKDKDYSSRTVKQEMCNITESLILDQAKNNIEDHNEKHEAVLHNIRAILEESPEARIYDAAIHTYYANKQDDELSIASYDYVYQIERLSNTRQQLINEKYMESIFLETAPQESIHVNELIDEVMIYEVLNDRFIFSYSIDTSESKEHVLPLKENTRYKIEIYSKKSLVNAYDLFSPGTDIKANVWSSVNSSVNNLEEAQGRYLLISEDQTDMSDEDKEKLSIELSKRPSYKLAEAPDVEFSEGYVNICVQDYEALRRLDKHLYVTIKELPYIFHRGKANRIAIKDRKTCVSNIELGVFFDKAYFVWVEDEDNRPLSATRFISGSQEETTLYSEASRQFHIKNYRDRVTSFVNRIVPETHTLLKETIDYLSTLDEAEPESLYKALIVTLSKRNDLGVFNKIADSILKDMYSSFLVDEQFFGEKLSLNKDFGILSLPRRHNQYIVQVDSFNVGDPSMTTNYYNIIDDIGVIHLSKSDYTIISMVDKESYARSGYVFLNSLKENTILEAWKLKIEVA